MVITIVCDVLGEENNGTTIAAMNLIRYLRSKGHTVRILCSDQDKTGQGDCFIVPNKNLGPLNNYVKKNGVELAKPDKKIIEEALNGADLVHIMIPFALGIAAAKIAHQKNIPITAGFHMLAENLTCHLKLNKVQFVNKIFYKFVYNHLYSITDAIHYPTQFVRDLFENSVHKTTNGYVISNGVNAYIKKLDVPKPKELEDKIVILTTGRFSREKSQDTLIKALKYSKHKDKIQLILAGGGPKEVRYKKLAQKVNITPIFNFFSREEILNVFNYCDLYIHTAQYELEGIACLEAITCGKLTIVSDSKLSATKSFAIDDKCIFKSRNAKDLARIIDFWIENEDLRKEYEQKYLEKSIDFNQNQCMQKMEQMMIEVINEKTKK